MEKNICPDCKNEIVMRSEIDFMKKNDVCFACWDWIVNEGVYEEAQGEIEREIEEREEMLEIADQMAEERGNQYQ